MFKPGQKVKVTATRYQLENDCYLYREYAAKIAGQIVTVVRNHTDIQTLILFGGCKPCIYNKYLKPVDEQLLLFEL